MSDTGAPAWEFLFDMKKHLRRDAYNIFSNRDCIIIEKKKRRCYYRHITILNPGFMIE